MFHRVVVWVSAFACVGCSTGSSGRDGSVPADATVGVDIVVQDVPPLPMFGPLRLLAPLSTSCVNSRTPTLRWLQPDGTTPMHVEVCSDRQCAHVEQSIDGVAHGHPTQALAGGVHYWRARSAELTTPVWEFFVRHQTIADHDTSWGTVVDVNGDGIADLLVGANHAANQRGHVDVFYGTRNGIGATADVGLDGVDPTGHFGWTVASAGDVNGDGLADVIVGAPDVAMSQGAAYVYLGSANGLATAASATLSPGGGRANFGTVVAGAGDTNGDGYADVLVSEPNAEGTAGRVFVYRGGEAGVDPNNVALLQGPDVPGTMFGTSLAGAGDVNGDGFADVLVGATGANNATGGASLFLGRAGSGVAGEGLMMIAPPTLPTSAQFGSAVGFVGDLDADGFEDLVVGATGTANGDAYVYRGGAIGGVPALSASLHGLHEMGAFATGVAGIGDANGDGYDDVAIGAQCEVFSVDPTNDGGYRGCGPGWVLLYPGGGGSFATTPAATIIGPGTRDGYFGNSVVGGDFDADGFADLAAAAPADRAYAGTVYLFHGGTNGVGPTPWQTLAGPDGSSENYGYSVALRPARTRRRAL